MWGDNNRAVVEHPWGSRRCGEGSWLHCWRNWPRPFSVFVKQSRREELQEILGEPGLWPRRAVLAGRASSSRSAVSRWLSLLARSDFLSLPFQAIECSLAGILPAGEWGRSPGGRQGARSGHVPFLQVSPASQPGSAHLVHPLSQGPSGKRQPWMPLTGSPTVPCGNHCWQRFPAMSPPGSVPGPTSVSTASTTGR